MEEQRRSPPKHRHDGTSPLPLGMDWSLHPSNWNGRNTIWPNDFRTGWSYCITIPSWVVVPKDREKEALVVYKVQVGLQSPKGITSTRTILRNFYDLLNLQYNLIKEFPKKNVPPPPPKHITRNWAFLEKRRLSLENWITRLLYDIDISRSIAVASFFELEAAAKSSFEDENEQVIERNISEIGIINLSLDKDMTRALEKLGQVEGNTSHAQEINTCTRVNFKNDGDLILQKGKEVSSDISLVLPLDQQQEMNKQFIGMQRKLRSAKSDMEDLIFQLKQEKAAKYYLTNKVKDLEDELESTKQKSKETLEQAILVERGKRKSLEMELKLKSQQDESANFKERDELLKELGDKLNHVLKKHEEQEANSKSDIKFLVEEIKSLWNKN